jgi:hypothetical protein
MPLSFQLPRNEGQPDLERMSLDLMSNSKRERVRRHLNDYNCSSDEIESRKKAINTSKERREKT